MTCPDSNLLAALDQLGEAERAAIVDHAASCESCRGVVLAVLATAQSPGSPIAPIAADPAHIDRYRVERRIGAGAMGVVYAAYDPELDRRVAVKLLRAGGSADRLRREAQVLAKLTHPNVVAVYDAGAFGDGTFIAMALVDGENLRTWLDKPRTPVQIIGAIVQAARGVAIAHAAGIVHRDIKPDNIFVGRDGVVLVGDFGLARPTGERASPHPGPLADSGELTQTGMIIGTPVYMAPEQIAGEATAASDQFSLCVTAWEALYGVRPFQGLTLEEIAAAIRRGPPDAPKSQVPARVHAAIRRGLAADPAERHASVAALVAALERRHGKAPILAGVAMAIGAATVAFVALRSGEPADPTLDAIARCDAEPALVAPRAAVAPPLGAIITARLDAYARQWTELRHATCVATARHDLPQPVNVATRRCLDRRSATLTKYVGDFATAKPEVALAHAEVLEPIESCRNVSPGPPPSPAIAQLQVTVDWLAVSQRVDQSLFTVDLDQVVRAADGGDPATSAEALFVAGAAFAARGRDAESLLDRAGTLADQARDDRIRARAAAALAEALAKTGRVPEAIIKRDLAASALVRTDDPIGSVAVEHASAVIARSQNDGAGQARSLRRIIELIRGRLGPDTLAEMMAAHELAFALQAAGDPQTQAAFDDAHRLATKLLPHGSVTELLGSLDTNDARNAVRASQDAVAAARRDHPELLPVHLLSLSFTYEQIGDRQGSLDSNLEVISLLDQLPADRRDASQLGEALVNAATMCHDLAEDATDKATRGAFLARAIALIDRRLAVTPDSPGAALRGRILVMMERYAEALPQLRAGLSDAEAEAPRNANRVGVRAFALARALWETGGLRDRARARALIVQAREQLAVARTAYDADHDRFGVALDQLDRRLARLGTWLHAHPEAGN